VTDPSTLEAGPELDRRVAEAIDDKVAGRLKHARISSPYFKPSTDWGDAMEAAEEFGLFDPPDRAWPILGKSGTLWVVYNCTSMEEISTPIADALTGPLAICRAILALSAAPP
jgi:hypothetical protein